VEELAPLPRAAGREAPHAPRARVQGAREGARVGVCGGGAHEGSHCVADGTCPSPSSLFFRVSFGRGSDEAAQEVYGDVDKGLYERLGMLEGHRPDPYHPPQKHGLGWELKRSRSVAALRELRALPEPTFPQRRV
ncbi:hypothetical protein FB451DRAFT_1205334, partial [Mycena latifolia]